MGFVGSSWRGWATRAPDVSRGLWDTVWDWVEGTRPPPVRPVHDEPVPKLRPKPGAVPTDQHASTAPIPLTALVAVSRVDVSGLLRQRIQSGQLQTSVGGQNSGNSSAYSFSLAPRSPCGLLMTRTPCAWAKDKNQVTVK